MDCIFFFFEFYVVCANFVFSFSSVRLYDIRQTAQVLDEFQGGDCPVVALHHVPRYHSGGSGVLVGTLKGTSYRPVINDFEAQRPPLKNLPALDGSVMWLAAHAGTGQMLASFRLSKSSVVVRHIQFTLQAPPPPDESSVSCSIHRQVMGGHVQTVLTRSLLLTHPESVGRLVACVTNEADCSAVFWDLSNGEKLQSLPRPPGKPYLAYAEMKSATPQANQPRLIAGIADGTLDIFKWRPAQEMLV